MWEVMVRRLGTGVGTGFRRCPERLAEEFRLSAVGSGESLKDLSKIVA